MEWFNTLMARLRALFRRESVLRDIEEELRVHVEMETETNIKRGMPPDEAGDAALKSFGALVRNTERGYDIRGGGWLETLWQDLRFGARMLVKQPGFTLIAVITLALGIGANTAIFSVIYAVLLRPLPYPTAERLVILTTGTNVDLPTYVSYPDYVDFRDRTHSFDDTACFVDDVFNVTGVEPAVAVDGRRVNWNFFQMLGVKPQVGRLFAPSDDQAGAVPTAAISDAFWHEEFGGDDKIIGKVITLDGSSFTVIGVLPPGFELQRRDDVFVPLGLWFIPGHHLLRRDNPSSHVLARLKAGVT